MIRYLSLFSGIEAASVACDGMEWEPLAFAEIDAFPSAVLKERFPSVPNLGDVTHVNWRSFVKDFGKPDLVVGGSPCQSFSTAGTRTGLEGASGLMWEYVRAVRDVRPEWVIWENVPGALSSTHGEDFRCLLEALDALGYGLAWRVLDAQFFGVAQRRERVFLVGRFGSRPPVEVLFEPEGVRWDSKPSREKRKELAEGAGRSSHSAGFKWHQGAGAGNIGLENELSPTCTARWHNPAVLIGEADGTRKSQDVVCIAESCGSGGGVRVQGDAAPTLRENRAGTGAMVVCMADAATNGTVTCMTDTQANARHEEELCGTLTSHAMKDATVVAYGDGRQNE